MPESGTDSPTPTVFDSVLQITATAHATHPPGTELDAHGDPIVKEDER